MRSLLSIIHRLGLCSLTLFLLALAANGCGKSTGTVSGKVFYKGKPLPGGTVNFTSEGSKSTMKTSGVESDGSYSVSGVPAGSATITVQGVYARSIPQFKGQGEKSAVAQQKAVYVPPKYGNAEESGLKYDVKSGPQPYDIKLE